MAALNSVYHLIWVVVGLISIFAVIIKILHSKFKTSWQKDIFELKNSQDLKNMWLQDINETIKCNAELCKKRIKENSESQFEMIHRDIKLLTTGQTDLKLLINNQQETLIAIQMGIADIKPRIDNLEKRVDKIEKRVE